MIPDAINPRNFQPGPGLIADLSPTDILALLQTLQIGEDQSGELAAYAEEDCERFMQTIHMLPAGALSVLEIGASPYFMTVLARLFRTDMTFKLTNYFGPGRTKTFDQVRFTAPDGTETQVEFEYDNINVETDRLPYDDETFDCVLFCEVLEHMTNNPMHALLELWRVLKLGGQLILTTPNVARLENVARLMSGWNIYDPYSGYGPYGRHNREYTKHELNKLLTHCGFTVDVLFTGDVHPNRAVDYYPDLHTLEPQLSARQTDLGQYHFSRWTKSRAPETRKPNWLYRSYPADALKIEDL